MRIFLSYRRADVGGHAGRLHDTLTRLLGSKGVFHDVTTIAPGRDFTREVDQAIRDCDAVFAVIGPGWLTATNPDGSRRLEVPHDYVRLELVRALQARIPLVPVLVGGAQLPQAADLPPELQALTQHQAVVLHDESWHEDVAGLMRRLRGEDARAAGSRRRLVAVAALVALVAAAGGAWWLRSDDEPASEDAEGIGRCESPSGDEWHSVTVAPDSTAELTLDEGPARFEVRDVRWRALQPDGWRVIAATSMANETPDDLYHGDWHYPALVVSGRTAVPSCFSPTPDLLLPDTVGDALVGFDVRCEPSGSLELVLDGGRIDVTGDAEATDC